MLENVPDWFVRKQQIGPWDDDYHDELIKWHKGYQKRKAQWSQIKKELMRIAWHPSRWWDWRVPELEKKRQKNFGCRALDHDILFCVWQLNTQNL